MQSPYQKQTTYSIIIHEIHVFFVTDETNNLHNTDIERERGPVSLAFRIQIALHQSHCSCRSHWAPPQQKNSNPQNSKINKYYKLKFSIKNEKLEVH